MNLPAFLELHNAEATPLSSLPEAEILPFRDHVVAQVAAGKRLAALFGAPGDGGAVTVTAVLADDAAGKLSVGRARLAEDRYPALTPDCPQAHWFERELAEQLGVVPEGHPWLKPIRFQAGLREAPPPPQIGVTRFFRVAGEEIHEVAVGPVHAGVIEPGHFRFQCHGEHVFHLEISLGYQHRGIERALVGGPGKRTLAQMETVAGDTTAGHAVAHALALEALSGTTPPPRAEALRGVALELERLANHAGDLGALANDVAYLPTASFCGRIRGDFLNMTAMLCGSRFGRGFVRPGGAGFDVDPERARELGARLDQAEKDIRVAVELLWDAPSVLSRFEGTGVVSQKTCDEIGLVGVAARACGVQRDVRRDHPHGIYQVAYIPVMTAPRGDVYARAFVRWLEIERSIEFLRERLRALPDTPVRAERAPLAPSHLAVSLVEGWRGEICHVAVTDEAGKFSRYKIVDPSFHNWFGLAMALRDEQISDFPLCNKSFNLSYCGHDL